jgi:hypothetical protein
MYNWSRFEGLNPAFNKVSEGDVEKYNVRLGNYDIRSDTNYLVSNEMK